jgi:hypothetical protein
MEYTTNKVTDVSHCHGHIYVPILDKKLSEVIKISYKKIVCVRFSDFSYIILSIYKFSLFLYIKNDPYCAFYTTRHNFELSRQSSTRIEHWLRVMTRGVKDAVGFIFDLLSFAAREFREFSVVVVEYFLRWRNRRNVASFVQIRA